ALRTKKLKYGCLHTKLVGLLARPALLELFSEPLGKLVDYGKGLHGNTLAQRKLAGRWLDLNVKAHDNTGDRAPGQCLDVVLPNGAHAAREYTNLQVFLRRQFAQLMED